MSMESQLGDVHQLITKDGKTLTLPDGFEIVLKGYGGYGAPPTEWVTRRGYRQHGVTEIDFNLSPRTVSVQLYRAAACSRERYWLNRSELHEFLRPNRGGALTYVIKQAGGRKRALKVRAQPGAVFAPQVDNNSWVIDESLDFIAFDPIWYDPDTITAALSITVDSNLVFPITFPITFGVSGAQFIYPITYAGSWQAYPIITLTGPFTSAQITNSATGAYIELSQGVNEGDTRIIDLTPGSQSVKDASGNNKFSDLSPGANLVGFSIEPDPIAPNGVQTITVILYGARVYSGTGWEVANQLTAPQRWYRLSDTDTTLQDVGSDNAAGVISGGYTQGVASLVPADANAATTVNGSTQLLTIPSLPLQNASFSMSIWVNFASLTGNPVAFGADVNAAALGQQFAFGATTAGAMIIYRGAGTQHVSANGLISTGTAYLLSVAYDRTTGLLIGMINGTVVISVTASDFVAPSPTCTISSYGTSNRTNGTVDEFRAWLGQALSSTVFAALYASRTLASRTYSPSGVTISYNNRYFAL